MRLFLEKKIQAVPAGSVSFVDVRDAAEAMLLAYEKGRAGERYLVSGCNCSVRDFFGRLERLSGVKAPWQNVQNQTPASTLVSNALSGRALFNTDDKAFSGANADEKKLFALHSGLNMLAALAGRFDQAGVSTGEQTRLSAAFESGLRQLDSFLAGAKFDALTMQLVQRPEEFDVLVLPHLYGDIISDIAAM